MVTQGWQMVAGQHNIGPQVELLKARDRKLSYRVDDSASLSFTLDGDDPAWEYLRELISDVWVFRNQKLFFRGRLGPTTDNIDENSNTVALNVFDYKEWLGRQFLEPGAIVKWRSQTRAKIIQDALNHMASRPGIKPAFTLDSSRLSTNLGDFDSLVGTSIKDFINSMSGFGWQVAPVDMFNLVVRAVSPFYHVLNDYYVMEYGGVIAKLQRQLDTATFANFVVGTGEEKLAPVVVRASNLASDLRGPLGYVQSDPTIETSSALVSMANEQLGGRRETAADWKVDLVAGGWINEDDAFLGDIVRFVVNSGRVVVNDMYRITEMDIDLSDDGLDQGVSMKLVKPPFVPVRGDLTTIGEHSANS